MRIIIDIPDNDYDNIMYNHEFRSWDMTVLEQIIAKGVDLDKHDEELIKETVANVWGTVVPMSVIEDIKTEIAEYKDDKVIHAERNEMVDIVLQIIDKHIRKEKK